MRAVVQRVRTATVTVGGDIVGSCQTGLVILLGVAETDAETDADRLAAKIARLRIFDNTEGRFDLSLLDVAGEALVVSQFTLIADTRKGNRPSFTAAAESQLAEPLVERFCSALEQEGIAVARGRFGSEDGGSARQRWAGHDRARDVVGARSSSSGPRRGRPARGLECPPCAVP